MGNFGKFDRNRGGGRNNFGGGHGGPRQMFPAVCGSCGQNCEVPFKPSGDRPVLCNNCFKGKDGDKKFPPKNFGGSNRGGGFSGGSNAPVSTGGISKAQFDALAAKVDRILSILTTAEIEATPKKEIAKKEPTKKVKTPAKKAKAKKK